MLRLSFLILFLILSFTFTSYGQQCGNGVYTLDFVQKDPIKYELYSITPKGMDWRSQEAKDWAKKNLSFFYEETKSMNRLRSVLLDKNKHQKVRDFLKQYKIEDFESFRVSHPKMVKAEGNIQYGVITFNTGEILYEPLIFKLISKKYGEFYLYGNFFGGCSRKEILDLSKNTITPY